MLPADIIRIQASGLFDATWYRLAYPYVVKNKSEPLVHFLRHGRRLRLSPGPKFDTARYLDQHDAARRSTLNPLVHYLRYGKALGLEVHPAAPNVADRIRASGLFDDAWYKARYPDVAAAGYPPLLHYMVHGAFEGRLPSPHFDAEWYLLHYPDIVGINPLLHYIDYGRDEGRIPVRPQGIIALAKKTVASVEDLDPDLYGADFFDEADHIDVVDGKPRYRVARAFRKIVAIVEKPPRIIVFLPWLVHGGADLVACHAIRAAVEEYGEDSILVVFSDHDREEALHLLPPNVPHLSFSRIDRDLSHLERIELVDILVRGLQPDAILNVNSHACWEAMKRYGRRLAEFTRLYAMLFCPDFSANARRSGYSDLYLRYCLPHLSGIYFDNRSYIDDVVRDFGVPDKLRSRLVALYQPAPAFMLEKHRRPQDRPLSVLWSGRFTPQKNIDLLIRIAESAPQFTFHIWGRGDRALEAQLEELSHRCSHVRFHGPFKRFDALPLADYDALLYTSRWDGLPNVLLEAASAGLPIVASQVGGIGELVDHETGWPVGDLNDPYPYIESLQAIADDPQRGQPQVLAMRKRLEGNHDWKRYRKILACEPSAMKGFLHSSIIDNGSTEFSPKSNV